MSIVLDRNPEVIALADIPTMGDDDFCHLIWANGPPSGQAVCGAKISPSEGWCCEHGYPPCGRVKCSECQYVWETEYE